MIESRTLLTDQHINGHLIPSGTPVEYDPIEGTARVILPLEFRVEVDDLEEPAGVQMAMPDVPF